MIATGGIVGLAERIINMTHMSCRLLHLEEELHKFKTNLDEINKAKKETNDNKRKSDVIVPQSILKNVMVASEKKKVSFSTYNKEAKQGHIVQQTPAKSLKKRPSIEEPKIDARFGLSPWSKYRKTTGENMGKPPGPM